MPTREVSQVEAMKDAARALLKPLPVQPDVPRWLRSRMVKAFGNPDRLKEPGDVLEQVVLPTMRREGIRNDWLNHSGTVKYGDRLCFVSEPYGLGPTELRDLAAFCDRLGLTWKLDPNSWHYPGKTFRIVISEPQGD